MMSEPLLSDRLSVNVGKVGLEDGNSQEIYNISVAVSGKGNISVFWTVSGADPEGCPGCPDTCPLLRVPFFEKNIFKTLFLTEQDASRLMIFERRCVLLINFRIKFNLILSFLSLWTIEIVSPAKSTPRMS